LLPHPCHGRHVRFFTQGLTPRSPSPSHYHGLFTVRLHLLSVDRQDRFRLPIPFRSRFPRICAPAPLSWMTRTFYNQRLTSHSPCPNHHHGPFAIPNPNDNQTVPQLHENRSRYKLDVRRERDWLRMCLVPFPFPPFLTFSGVAGRSRRPHNAWRSLHELRSRRRHGFR
jgi:hypothetical protein